MDAGSHQTPDTDARGAQPTGPGALSPRLQAMRQAIGPAPFLIDVGTDHARLPLAWLDAHPNAKALGIDQCQKPLVGAAKHRDASPSGARLELRLQAGLGELRPPTGAALSISGMGGRSIQDILYGATAVRQHQLARIVLGPNDRFDAVRHSLSALGWRICAEQALWERERFYPIIQAAPAPHAQQAGATHSSKPTQDSKHPSQAPCPNTSIALEFGPHLLSCAHPALAKWLHRQALRLHQIQVRLGPKRTAPELIDNLETIKSAWAQYFKNQYGELLAPDRLTQAPGNEHN